MKTLSMSLVLVSLIIFPSITFADVWIPPWGEVVYDSIQIDIQVGDAETSVGVISSMVVRKLVGDDYLLNYLRGTQIGNLDEDNSIAEVSDQLNDFEADGDLITFTYLSTVAQEAELFLTVSSRYTYTHENQAQMLNELVFNQAFQRTSSDSAWGMVDWMPVYERGDFQVSISSNVDISACTWDSDNQSWGRLQEGRNISLTGAMSDIYDNFYYNFACPVKIEFANNGESVDTLFEEVVYELTPETREMTPNLILDEDIRIQMSSWNEEDTYDYALIADINLHPGMAMALSPMWLWFPNDQTQDPDVKLEGIFARGGWGCYPEISREEQLEIRQGRVNDQDGFYIRFPSLQSEYSTPNDSWFWTETSLHVEIRQEVEGASVRFILITAPTESSTIQITIPQWRYFNTWENPLEEVQIRRNFIGNVLTFSGYCPEPGIASVTWSDQDVAQDASQLPDKFKLNSVYPNPFNSTTTVSYSLPAASEVSLKVFDLSGRKVKSLVDGYAEAGDHSVSLSGEGMASGVYLVRMKAGKQEYSRKVLLVR